MGGGGSSSSKNYTYNTIDVKPVTNVDVDFDVQKIADAIRDSSGNQLASEKTKILLAEAGLELEKNKLLADVSQTEKTRKQVTTVLILVGGYYVYNKLKKGVKKK